MTNPLIQILDRHPEYTRLRDAMVNGEGPAGVFGLGESHKGHIAAALSTGRAVLLPEGFMPQRMAPFLV